MIAVTNETQGWNQPNTTEAVVYALITDQPSLTEPGDDRVVMLDHETGEWMDHGNPCERFNV
jgi:hypothetical protein